MERSLVLRSETKLHNPRPRARAREEEARLYKYIFSSSARRWNTHKSVSSYTLSIFPSFSPTLSLPYYSLLFISEKNMYEGLLMRSKPYQWTLRAESRLCEKSRFSSFSRHICTLSLFVDSMKYESWMERIVRNKWDAKLRQIDRLRSALNARSMWIRTCTQLHICPAIPNH